MIPAPDILITAPTGNVGSEIVRLISQRDDLRVRLGMRNPGNAQGWDAARFVPVQFDFTQPELYAPALEGIQRVFALMPLSDGGMYRHVNRFVDAAKDAGVRHLVFMGGMGSEHVEGEPIREIEQHIMASGLSYTLLRPNWFMQDFSNDWFWPGLQEGELLLPAGEGRFSFVDTRDIAEVALKSLLSDDYTVQAFTLTGEEVISLAEAVAQISQIAGRALRYTPQDPQEFLEQMQAENWPQETIFTLSWLYEDVRLGKFAQVTDSVEQILGRRPRRFAQYLADYAHVWR